MDVQPGFISPGGPENLKLGTCFEMVMYWNLAEVPILSGERTW